MNTQTLNITSTSTSDLKAGQLVRAGDVVAVDEKAVALLKWLNENVGATSAKVRGCLLQAVAPGTRLRGIVYSGILGGSADCHIQLIAGEYVVASTDKIKIRKKDVPFVEAYFKSLGMERV